MMARQLFVLSSFAFVASNAFIPTTFHPHRHSTDDRSLHVAFAEREPFITGNWKMNPSSKQEAIALATDIAASLKTATRDDELSCDVALFVPFPYLESVQNAVGDKLIVGAQVRHRR
jgi:triosephosphate isomerase (TIM)